MHDHAQNLAVLALFRRVLTRQAAITRASLLRVHARKSCQTLQTRRASAYLLGKRQRPLMRTTRSPGTKA